MDCRNYRYIYQYRIDGKLCSMPCTGREACDKYAHSDCLEYETFGCLVLLGFSLNEFVACKIEKGSGYTDEETGCTYVEYKIIPAHTYDSSTYYIPEH